ncbi:tRNA (N(6)-L-threonylcarbamoyladenosine(37)-C(2))-methylthiotransferase [Candidatus Woesearchaeota archaeon]|nr:tRNA (N(6)-L-threonylcarbamoyladenosine(37)-C(2))-methylthiotransferase [Candidatus Woesearchaeota archaeon]
MKVYIETFGCSANLNDSEIMAGMLDVVDSPEKADVIIVNTCTVKGRTEDKVKSFIKRLHSKYPKKKLVIAGCMAEAQSEMLKKLFPKAALIGPHRISEIQDVVDGKIDEALGYKDYCKLKLPKKSSNPRIAIVQINDGCANFCTFCITKLAKPKLVSYPVEMIIDEVLCAVSNGFKEIWLTSQDTGAYGLDRKTNLAKLLKELLKIKGDFKIRVGMMNPKLILPFLSELIELYKDEKIYKFLHIPFQAGSDEVLKKMRRGYGIADFRKIVAEFRKEIPRITLATDVICGFPGETEQQFKESLQLLKEVKPDVLNISKYWPRPGTEAAKMKQVSGAVLKQRASRMVALFRSLALEKNKEWVGWKGDVFISEIGKNSTLVGRNFAYKPIILNGNTSFLGSTVRAEIVSSAVYGLRGRIL